MPPITTVVLQDLEACARHEVGHALIAEALGLVPDINVTLGLDITGRELASDGVTGFDQDALNALSDEDWLLLLMAGPVAERTRTLVSDQLRREFGKLSKGKSAGDIQIERMGLYQGDTDAAQIFDRFHTRGRAEVKRMNGDAVERATQILKQRRGDLDLLTKKLVTGAVKAWNERSYA